jgi:hypothetical protein
MAEVIDYWPDRKPTQEAQMVYPWEHWTKLDEKGAGDIWLAELGIDFPATHTVMRFRVTLYKRAQVVTKQRRAKAKKALVVKGGSVSMEPIYDQLKVRVVIVSETQVAFQFFEGDEPPVVKQGRAVVPRIRRKNLNTKPVPLVEKADIRGATV